MSVDKLAKLSALASATPSPEDAVQSALPLLQEALGADEVCLVYGDDHGFGHFGTCPVLALTDVALWLIHHDVTTRGKACAFDVRDGHVEGFRSAASRRPCQYVAALIPVANRTAEMLVASGSWPGGLSASRRRFMETALPALALLLERRLDSARGQRQRSQLSALANIHQVMSESEDLGTVITDIAGTISLLTGIDYISIDIMDADGNVKLRCLNSARSDTKELQTRWQQGARNHDPVRDEVLRTGKPLFFRDAQTDERIPEKGRNYFVRTLIRSTACFPLLAKDDVLGILSAASHRPLTFSSQEVELLEGLTAQVAAAVKGVQVYQELTSSREELQRLNAQLHESMGVEHHLARTDALTGLPNRRYIEEALTAECARAGRYDQPVSVVMADLDYLKAVNDSYGHRTGDDALRLVATVVRQTCRAADLVGRWGGDEFVFILPSTDGDEATKFAERVRRALADQAFSHPNLKQPHQLTISLGVTQATADSFEDADLLLARADKAMYEAKMAGRNRTVVIVGDNLRAA